MVFRGVTIPLMLAVVALCRGVGEGGEVFTWSGHEWRAKASGEEERLGPGPNWWSDAKESVWVDGQDRLHLKVRRVGDKWVCAEVVNEKSLGYGRHFFYLSTRPDQLDRNVVVGLFTHLDDEHELDIEISRWGEERQFPFHQYVVQPGKKEGNMDRGNFTKRVWNTTHGIVWQPGRVLFGSYEGHVKADVRPMKFWEYRGPDIPKPGGERVHINLWLYQGSEGKNRNVVPVNGKEAELVVDRFLFVPWEADGEGVKKVRDEKK